MPFDPALTTPIDCVRFNVGDTATAPLLPDTTYQAVLARHTSGDPAVIDEAAATRDIARALAARYAIEPSSLSSKGSSLTWGERVAQWNLIANGGAGGAAAGRVRGAKLRRYPSAGVGNGCD